MSTSYDLEMGASLPDEAVDRCSVEFTFTLGSRVPYTVVTAVDEEPAAFAMQRPLDSEVTSPIFSGLMTARGEPARVAVDGTDATVAVDTPRSDLLPGLTYPVDEIACAAAVGARVSEMHDDRWSQILVRRTHRKRCHSARSYRVGRRVNPCSRPLPTTMRRRVDRTPATVASLDSQMFRARDSNPRRLELRHPRGRTSLSSNPVPAMVAAVDRTAPQKALSALDRGALNEVLGYLSKGMVTGTLGRSPDATPPTINRSSTSGKIGRD